MDEQMTISRLFPSGGYLASAMLANHLVSCRYFDCSKEEAIEMFKEFAESEHNTTIVEVFDETNDCIRFCDLAIGQVFRFESERTMPYSGLASGPWRKISARKYARVDSGASYILHCHVGSANVKVFLDSDTLNERNEQ